MRTRIGAVAEGAFIGTIHSYANKLCLLNNKPTFELIDEAEFDKLLTEAMTIPKEQLPEIEHLLIDESQDLVDKEYFFIERLRYKNIFYVGDIRQQIYQFKGSSDRFIIDMVNNPEYKTYFLTENYRNAPNILQFANGFLSNFDGISPSSIAVKKSNGIVERMGFMAALDELEEQGNWGSWFILSRTNKEVELIQRILDAKEIPNLTFKSGNLEGIDELSSVLKENKVKVLTIHASKGLEIQNVIVVGALTYTETERKLAYVAATRAMNCLYWCPKIPAQVAKRFAPKEEEKSLESIVERDSQMIMF